MVLTNEELLKLRDIAVEQYSNFTKNIRRAEEVLRICYKKRGEMIERFNDDMFEVDRNIDKVKNGKLEFIMMQEQIEKDIKEFNSLIAGRRLE